MGLLLAVFIIEMLIACIVYFLFRRLRVSSSLVTLAVGASLVALVAGWTVGYRASKDILYSEVRDQTNVQLQISRGTDLSKSELRQMLEKLNVNPEVQYSLHKSAAIHTLPGFIVVLLIMIGIAKKHEKRDEGIL